MNPNQPNSGEERGPQKFRKKPVEIEAWQLTNESVLPILHWCNADEWGDHPAELRIKTREGVMTASEGDYIVKGVKGEFYPCKPDIFEATYDDADTPEELPHELKAVATVLAQIGRPMAAETVDKAFVELSQLRAERDASKAVLNLIAERLNEAKVMEPHVLTPLRVATLIDERDRLKEENLALNLMGEQVTAENARLAAEVEQAKRDQQTYIDDALASISRLTAELEAAKGERDASRAAFRVNHDELLALQRDNRALAAKVRELSAYKKTSEELPEIGEVIIGHKQSWVCPDFNPKGVRECFRSGDGNLWTCAAWVDSQDYWATVSSDDDPDCVPDYWTSIPNPVSTPPDEGELNATGLVNA